MMKKRMMTTLLCSITLLYAISPIMVSATGLGVKDNRINYENREDLSIQSNENVVYKFRNETVNALNTIKGLISIAVETESKEAVTEAIDVFTGLKLSREDVLAHDDGDEIDALFKEIYNLILTLPEADRNDRMVYYQQKLIECWKRKNVINGVEFSSNFFYQYAKSLRDMSTIPEIKESLKKGVLDMDNYISQGNLEKPIDYSLDGKDDGRIPNAPNLPKEQKPDTAPSFNNQDSSTRYEKIGDTVFKIVEHYDKNGKLVKTDKTKATKEEYIYAGIFSHMKWGGGIKEGVPSGISYTDSAYQFENPESNLTIQYTLDKDQKTSYYYDTGIRTAMNGTISCNQLSDVLYQVAIKSEGHFVSDVDKFLVVIEGKPIVIKNSKTSYTKNDINAIFKDFSRINVTILETRIGKCESLETQVLSKEAKSIKVNDKDIELSVNPVIKNDRLLLPIESIVKEIGGTVEVKENNYVFNIDGKEVKYVVGKNYFTINGRDISMGSNSEIKDDSLMVEVQDLLKNLNYEILWDGESGIILISKI